MRTAALAFAVILLAGPCAAAAPPSAGLTPVHLRCEYAVDPMGVDVPSPRLFWQVDGTSRGQRQTAWQVLVASTAASLDADRGDLWDSGRVPSDETIQIPYGGAPLVSSQRVYWKVRAWDRDGLPSRWSAVATWTMGVLAPGDWKGIWIAAPAATETLLLRGTFTVKPGLVRAIAHVSGLGHYEFSLNGHRVGDALLTPGWTNYDKTTLYDTYDVTAVLQDGRNAAGLFLGNGMYHVERRNRFAKFTGSFGPLRGMLHLRLEYADGTVLFAGTGPGWRSHAGPITYSSIYGGEDYDARLEIAGWNTITFDDGAWSAAIPVIRLEGTLRGQSAAADPIRVIEHRQPVGSRTFPDGSTVIDFGQNASFMPSLQVTGPAGSTVRLTPSEVLHPDGTINRRTMGSDARGSSWWQFTKATDGEEIWTPRFYYVGSRYVKVEYFPPAAVAPSETHPPGVTDTARRAEALPTLVSVEALIVHADATSTGRFITSNPRLNGIRDLVRWAQRSNMVSVLTDCPHREKLGWLEQYHLNGPSLRFEFDAARIFRKGMRDMADAQTDDGLVPDIAPEYTVFKGAFRNAAEWGAAFVQVPWQQYQFTADTDLLRTHYAAMVRYVAFLESRATDGILADGLGDWYDLDLGKPGQNANLTPAPITATAYYWLDLATLARIATVLGTADDATVFARKADDVRAAWLARFSRPEAGSFGTGSQASLAIPLAMGLLRPESEPPALAKLVADVETRGYATAGDIGFRSLLQALASRGRSDVIYRLVNQDDKPGYGFQIAHGATSLTEAWDANLTSSHNHFMLGQIIEWFYQDLAGITPDDTAGPGFKTITVRPSPVSGLGWVDASYDSIRGPVAVRWEQSRGTLTLRVSIPANTTAQVFVPSHDAAKVRENGQPAAKSPGVTFVRIDGDRAIYRVESGSYTFTSPW
jgi:alpha-L-rhamnosidase